MLYWFEQKYKKKIAKLKKTYKSEMSKLGVHIAKGFAKGIEKGSSDVYKAIAKMTGQTVKQVKKSLGIHSPSKVMAELGGYTGLGFVQGLQKETQNLADIITNSLPTKVDAPSISGTNTSVANNSNNIPVQLNLMMDSKVIASSTFNQLDVMQGANIKLIQRGLSRG